MESNIQESAGVDDSNNDQPVRRSEYNPDQVYLLSIEQEASTLFPPGKFFTSVKQLRQEVVQLGNKYGFVVATDGFKLCCNGCSEPASGRMKREKANASGLTERSASPVRELSSPNV
jgi:hypothetical protein